MCSSRRKNEIEIDQNENVVKTGLSLGIFQNGNPLVNLRVYPRICESPEKVMFLFKSERTSRDCEINTDRRQDRLDRLFGVALGSVTRLAGSWGNRSMTSGLEQAAFRELLPRRP